MPGRADPVTQQSPLIEDAVDRHAVDQELAVKGPDTSEIK
jgi:hypothetical protein